MLTGDVSDSFFGGTQGSNRYANPFFNIPSQFLPTNIDGMLWWAEHFLVKIGFYKAALQRVADYFVTELTIDCEDEESEKEYKDTFESLKWKNILTQSGLNLLAYGNEFLSINQGFNRFLNCPKCSKFSIIDRIDNFKFEKGKFYYACPNCKYSGVHRLVDKPIKDIEQISPVHWNPREVKIKHDVLSNKSEYYWQIPESYQQMVTRKGDKFYPKVVPEVVFKSIVEDKMVVFNKKNFIHLKMPTPASFKTDGKAIPLCMYMFDSLFMCKVLERFNEVICYEDISPFRVIAMADNVPPQHPALANQNGGVWAAAVDKMIDDHRKDPGSYHKFPFPISFQYLNRDGKQLAPIELLELAQANILNALNIPQELFKMTLQTQTIGPALRLFENSWSSLVASYNQLLQHIGDVICKIRGLAPARFGLIPVTFADDMERKSVIGQLVSSNSIARSELLELYGYEYKDQIRKKMQEDLDAKEIQEEEQKRQQLKEINSTSIFNQQGGQGGGAAPGGSPGDNVGSGAGSSPQDILQQAQQLAQQIQPMEGAERRQELQKIKAQNETLWSAVKGQLQQMDQGAKSQGLQQAKQQGQQG